MGTGDFEGTFNESDLLMAVDKIFPLAEHYKNILSIHLNALKGSEKIIDLGCGTGILTIEYLKNGRTVTGVDISSASLEILRNKAVNLPSYKNLTIIKADMTNLKEIGDDSFDGASSMIASHLVDDYEKHISECYRVLKTGGRFIITARRKGQDQEKIIEIVENSLLETNEFEKYKEDFIVLRDKLLKTAKDRSKSLFATDESIRILQEAGFGDIQEIPNKTKGVMYSLLAKK